MNTVSSSEVSLHVTKAFKSESEPGTVHICKLTDDTLTCFEFDALSKTVFLNPGLRGPLPCI